MMKRNHGNPGRPLSPNIQVYRPQLTSVLSIGNRITGVVLSVCAIVLVLWLVAAASGPEAYTKFQRFIGSILGRGLLMAATFAFFMHFFGGIRHLVWDTGRGLQLRQIYSSGWAVIAASVAFTLVVWLAISMLGGPSR